MSRKKSITLLSIIGTLVAILIVLTFVAFPVGAVKNYNSALGAIELDYDIEGGMAYTLELSDDNEEEVTDINQVVKTFEYRLSSLGYSVYSVKAIKSTDPAVLDYDIRIETKNTDSISSDISAVMAYGEVAFYGGTSANPTEQIMEDIKVIKSAKYEGVYGDSDGVVYQMSIAFTDEAYEFMKDAITTAEGESNSYYLEVKLGETVLISGSSAITTGSFVNRSLYMSMGDEASVKQMVLQVSSGGLKYEYEIASTEKISSPYGENVGAKCAIGIGVLLVILLVALVLIYKGFGIVSAISTLLFMLIEIWMLIAVPGIVLSLGGVLGIAVALLISVYSMIVTASRIKEEYSHSEKTVKAAINKGFKQSLIPVLGINLVAGFVAIVLLAFTTGTVNCFAITLGIGAVISAIASLVFTRLFTALILPLIDNKENFLDMKKEG